MVIDNVDISLYPYNNNRLFINKDMYCIEFKSIVGNIIKRIYCDMEDIECMIDDIEYVLYEYSEDNIFYIFNKSDSLSNPMISIDRYDDNYCIITLYNVYNTVDIYNILTINCTDGDLSAILEYLNYYKYKNFL